MAPFLQLEQIKVWSPLTVFDKQQLSGSDEDAFIEGSLLGLEEEEADSSFVLKRKERFVHVVEALLRCYTTLGRHEVRLSEFIEYLDQDEAAGLKRKRDFYDCWIMLHQRSPIRPLTDDEEARETERSLYEAIRTLLQGKTLTVQEAEGVLRVNERYSIQELVIRLGEEWDELQQR